ncbi:mRNA cleavage and polyadenylation factor subunit [Ceratobasidium sp. 428]|nr:mRNA cleavage and polyadenylation factor subunit [Ceratobasidium sp. 428]
MRNEIFVAGIGGSGSGSGERAKGAKAGITAVSPANTAYVAVMLRFVLRRPDNWYHIKPGRKDKRYDYNAFYLAKVSFLETPTYAEEMKELISFLSWCHCVSALVRSSTHLGHSGWCDYGWVDCRKQSVFVSNKKLLPVYLVERKLATGGRTIRQTMATSKNGLDRPMVSSEDATIALLEWSDVAYGLITVSIRTYERAIEVITNDNVYFRSLLRVDPLYCCAALLLALGGLALLPFYQTQAELDIPEQEQNGARRLHEVLDTTSLITVTLDILTCTYPIISHATSLPMTLKLSHRALAVDGWSACVSPLTSIAAPYILAMGTGPEGVDLNRASVTWMSDEETEAARFLPNGSVRSVQVEREGRAVHALSIGPELGGRVAKAERGAVRVFGEWYGFGFIGSVDAESVLARVVGGIGAKAEEEPEESDEDMGDEDDLYGDTNAPTTVRAGTALQPITGFAGIDTLPTYGEINSMVFSLAKNGRGTWTLVIALRTKSSGPGELDTVVMSTDLAPSPGIFWIAKTTGGAAGDIQTLARTPGLTMAAGPFFQQGCIARITTNSIRLLEPDGAGRQLYLDADGNKPRPNIKAAYVAKLFIVVLCARARESRVVCEGYG